MAQVCIRWGMQQGFVMLPKSETPARIAENFGEGAVFGWELTQEEISAIDGICTSKEAWAQNKTCWTSDDVP